ncbi:unnamed protein product [Caenorhabditis sp. 36 PRJEB53466]|nr:unnamed protein product [Caenorhabditis sp. 36 PRJEB53466]
MNVLVGPSYFLFLLIIGSTAFENSESECRVNSDCPPTHICLFDFCIRKPNTRFLAKHQSIGDDSATLEHCSPPNSPRCLGRTRRFDVVLCGGPDKDLCDRTLKCVDGQCVPDGSRRGFMCKWFENC